MGMFDEFTENARVLSEDEMRNVKAGEKYYYKITCPDGTTRSGAAEVKNGDFKAVVDTVCGEGASGVRAIFC